LPGQATEDAKYEHPVEVLSDDDDQEKEVGKIQQVETDLLK
jgi:hypothetical protein